jgi:hypothetical protein
MPVGQVSVSETADNTGLVWGGGVQFNLGHLAAVWSTSR